MGNNSSIFILRREWCAMSHLALALRIFIFWTQGNFRTHVSSPWFNGVKLFLKKHFCFILLWVTSLIKVCTSRSLFTKITRKVNENKNSPSKNISNRDTGAGVHSVAFMTLNIFRCDIVNWHQISQESLLHSMKNVLLSLKILFLVISACS